MRLFAFTFSLVWVAAAQNPTATITVDAAANRRAINPNIYGVAYGTTQQLSDLNVPVNRYGGNNTSRYNWQINGDNRGQDWYFESIGDDSAVAGERGGVPGNAAFSGRDVGEPAGGGHVASLALHALRPGRAFQPLRIGAIYVDAEHGPLMAGGAVAAFAIERHVPERLAWAHGVFQRAEEELLASAGPQQKHAVAAKAHAQLIRGHIHHLVAEIAVDAIGCRAGSVARVAS